MSTKIQTNSKEGSEYISEAENFFEERMKLVGYKPHLKKYKEAQAEFFSGASVCLETMPPLWFFSIIRGDSIIEERKKMLKNENS